MFVKKTIFDRDSFQAIVKEELEKIDNIDLLIIRGQILIEYVFTKFIEDYSIENNYTIDNKFSFYSKFNICQLLGLYNGGETQLIEQIKIINKMRNGIAHDIKINRTLLPNLYKYHSELKATFKKAGLKGEEFDKKMLHMIFSYLCGNFAGRAASVNLRHNTVIDCLLDYKSSDGETFDKIYVKRIEGLKMKNKE